MRSMNMLVQKVRFAVSAAHKLQFLPLLPSCKVFKYQLEETYFTVLPVLGGKKTATGSLNYLSEVQEKCFGFCLLF